MLKIGIIGLGDIAAKAYLPVISARPGLDIHLCSRNREQMEQLAAQYRFTKMHGETGSLIAAGIDGAFVHAATLGHAAIIRPLLEAGIPVFVDKPISLHYEESAALTELAKQNGTFLTTGFNRRFAPVYRELKAINEPTLIVMQKNRHQLPGEIRSFILDDFIHVVDTLLWLLPAPAHRKTITCMRDGAMLKQITIQFTTENGATAIGIMNRNTTANEERLEVMSAGEKKIAVNVSELVAEERKSSSAIRGNDWEPTLHKRGFAPMITDFLSALENRTQPAISMDDALYTHRICEEIIEEIMRGG
ncbi:MAG: Gfo/Idh/MocA family oxidoreductase [Mucilaginibacter polytrichastri]|nr:Gfo/Idh/MocA family oxidoreductase [Mucilaginibacter polytrichastri]